MSVHKVEKSCENCLYELLGKKLMPCVFCSMNPMFEVEWKKKAVKVSVN